jgi:hypothetical protein
LKTTYKINLRDDGGGGGGGGGQAAILLEDSTLGGLKISQLISVGGLTLLAEVPIEAQDGHNYKMSLQQLQTLLTTNSDLWVPDTNGIEYAVANKGIGVGVPSQPGVIMSGAGGYQWGENYDPIAQTSSGWISVVGINIGGNFPTNMTGFFWQNPNNTGASSVDIKSDISSGQGWTTPVHYRTSQRADNLQVEEFMSADGITNGGGGGGGVPAWGIYISNGGLVSSFGVDSWGNFGTTSPMSVGDLVGGSTPLDGMIRFNGTIFQGYYSGAWHDFGSGITGSPFDVVLLDSTGLAVSPGKLLYDNSGNTAVDLVNRELYTDSGVPVLSWATQVFRDTSNIAAVNWQNRTTLDAVGHLSMDWNLRHGVDSSNNTSLGWEERNLYYTSGYVSLDWYTGRLVDVSAVSSMNWNMRLAYDSLGAESMDWNLRQLMYAAGNPALDWAMGVCYALDATASVYFGGRTLLIASGQYVMDWAAQNLITPSGATVFNWSTLQGVLRSTTAPIGVSGYSSGGTVDLVLNSVCIVNQSTTTTLLVLNFPSGAQGGDKCYAKFTNPVTSLAYSGGTINYPPTEVTGQGALLTFIYDSASAQWF